MYSKPSGPHSRTNMPNGFQALFLSTTMRLLVGRLAVFGEVVLVEIIVGGEPKPVPFNGDAHHRIVEPVGHQRPLESLAIGLRVEADDRIGEGLDGRTARPIAVGMAFADVDASFFINRHGDGIDDQRIGGNQLQSEILWENKLLELLLRAQARLDLGIGDVDIEVWLARHDCVAGQVPWPNAGIAEDGGGGPRGIVEFRGQPVPGSCLRDFGLRIGADNDFLAIGQFEMEPSDRPCDPAMVGRFDRQQVFTRNQVFRDVIFPNRAPFLARPDHAAIDKYLVLVIRGDLELRAGGLGGHAKDAA